MVKNVLITGANRGFGRSLAQQFADHGYGVYLVVRRADVADELQRLGDKVAVLVADVTQANYEQLLVQWLGNTTLDVVINNAGCGTKAPTLAQTQPEFLRKEFETNCVAVLATVKGSLAALKRAGAPLVVNVSSRRGSLTMQSQGAAKGSGCSYSYRISKAAQNMLTLCLADDLEEDGIRLVSLHPGRLVTDMAAVDAHLSADEAARRLLVKIEEGELNNRDYISLERGHLPW